MERVQFQQEQMLAELKDLVQKGLFTVKETKEIMKKRTAFETALVRRVSKKADFLRYAAYEMGLEQLRIKRVERLKLPPSPPSVSDYALVRRQFHIFERALKKFKADVGLWIQYIQVAQREGARALVGRITARAVQLHPNTPALYIIAASQEIDNQSPSSARALLQRGIRLNGESVEMWTEYVKMELGFVESLRRRWEVLGIDVSSGADSDDVAKEEIMKGAIVKSVISSAAKAINRIDLFKSLEEMIIDYPTPSKEGILEHLYEELYSRLGDSPEGIEMYVNRVLKGEDLIDRVKRGNEELSKAVSKSKGLRVVYERFVNEWCGKDIDDNLKLYLTQSCL